MTIESFLKRSKNKDFRTKYETTKNKTTFENTNVEKNDEKTIFKSKSNSNDDKLWYFKKTFVWNQIVEKWKKDYREDFDKFKTKIVDLNKNAKNWFIKLKFANKISNQTFVKLKRYQFALSNVKNIAMIVAIFDSHKIASIICAIIFDALNVKLWSFSSLISLINSDLVQCHEFRKQR